MSYEIERCPKCGRFLSSWEGADTESGSASGRGDFGYYCNNKLCQPAKEKNSILTKMQVCDVLDAIKFVGIDKEG